MRSISTLIFGILTYTAVAFAQDTPPPTPPPPAQDQPAAPTVSIPQQLTIQPGTYVTVRLNQRIATDRNQVGDAFSATLVRPIVVDGIVVAQRGQTLGGRVSEVKKAGRIEGTSRLGLQLTDLPIVDGQQVPIQTQLFSRSGPTSVGRDVTAIVATTAVGAGIGGAVAAGSGAAAGAGAGLIAGTVAVLLTRGHQTVIGPETVLTFRIEQPIAISTGHASYAFRYVEPNDYAPPPAQLQTRPRTAYAGGPGYPPPPYYAPAYGYPYYPYWGPGFAFYGPGFLYGPRFGVGFRFGRRW